MKLLKLRLNPAITLAMAFALLAAPLANLSAQPAKAARSSPQWVRDGVVYEIFPRNFSAEGNFNGITAHLDELKNLGVNILWLMPIHPLGEKLRKGTLGSRSEERRVGKKGRSRW